MNLLYCGCRKLGWDGAERLQNTSTVFFQAWEQFIPLLVHPPELRKVMYTTNGDRVIERPDPSRGQPSEHLLTDQAAMKVLYLGVKQSRRIAPDALKPPNWLPPTSVDTVGIECSGSWGTNCAVALHSSGLDVREVPSNRGAWNADLVA